MGTLGVFGVYDMCLVEEVILDHNVVDVGGGDDEGHDGSSNRQVR